MLEVKSMMSLLLSSSLKGMADTNDKWQACDTIKLYKTNTEKGRADQEILSIDIWNNQSEMEDLKMLIRLYLKEDMRVKAVVKRIKGNLP